LLGDVGRKKKKDPELALARGILELKSGDPQAARATFLGYKRKAREEKPPPIFYAYAVLAAASAGNVDEALALGREGLSDYPEEATILVNTGVILDRNGDHEAAEQYFIRALQSGSATPPQAHKNLGDQAFRRGELEAARSHYEAAVKMEPSLGDDVFQKLGSIAAAEGDEELAVLFLRRAVELNPGNEGARSQLADLSALP
jgi:tetratricopeptide (TPR) repeat protein